MADNGNDSPIIMPDDDEWKRALVTVGDFGRYIPPFLGDAEAVSERVLSVWLKHPGLKAIMQDILPEKGFWAAPLWTISGLVLCLNKISAMSDIVEREAIYEAEAKTTSKIPDYRELIRLAFLLPGGGAPALEAAKKQGISKEWWARQVLLARPLLDANTLAGLAVQQKIPDGAYLEAMGKQGWMPEHSRALRELSYFTPGWDVIWDLHHRGLLTPQLLGKLKEWTGTHPDLVEAMEGAEFALLGFGMIRDLYLRGKLSDSEVAERLTALGVADTDLQHYTTLWRPTTFETGTLPPFQDVIQMAVRDVFDPQAVSRYGLAQHYPEQVNEFALLTGVSTFWAQKYWQAHWVMPGPAMARQMLFLSDRFSESDLRNLYRYADYPPGLIDAMTDATYNPLTRVDVRRMHAVGVLSVSDVRQSYERLGFNEQDAQRMTDFTVAYNEDETVVGAKGHILKGVEEYILTEGEAVGMLVAMGLTSQVAGDLVAGKVVERELEAEADLLNTIERLYVRGAIPESEARQRLSVRGYSADRIGALMERFNNSRERSARVPTRADLDRWLRQELIDGQEYMDRMGRLGYRVEDATLYLRSVVSGAS